MPEPLRVTTDPEYYEGNTESVELWSPGNPFFTPLDLPLEAEDLPEGVTVADLLEQ